MRLVTKAILLLSLVALGVFFLYMAGRRGGDGSRVAELLRPGARTPEAEPPHFDDPLAAYERWRDRLVNHQEPPPGADEQPAAPGEPHVQDPRDLVSSSEDEGTIVAIETDLPVLGADPPGPTLKPEGLEGVIVTARWKLKKPEAGAAYVVRNGDTLYAIAARRYGDPGFVRIIQAANPNVDPRRLKVGEQLILPEPPGPGEKPTPRQAKVYVVRRNDTLIGIARRFYSDAAMYRKIFEANRDILSSPNATLHVGQRLRLPEL